MKKVTLQAAIERAIENAGGVRALAALADLSDTYISDLRHGKLKNPSINVCRKLGIVRDPDYTVGDSYACEYSRTGSDMHIEPRNALRDEFAMAALQGMMSKYGNDEGTDEDRAKWAYEQADAMMEQRQLQDKGE